MTNYDIIDRIWDFIDEQRIYSTKEEKKYIKLVVEKEEELLKSLNENQLKVFTDYQTAIDKLYLINGKENFKQGLRFATEYLCEVMKEEY